MEYLVGALAATVVYLVLDKYRSPKTVGREETREEKEAREKMESHVESIMNYSAEKAVRHE